VIAVPSPRTSGVFSFGENNLTTRKKSKGAAAAAAVEEQTPQTSTAVAGEIDLANDWLSLVEDDSLEFFDLLQALPERAWDELTVYLYRLDPPVSNRGGEKKYIGVYGSPITEQQIKEAHGGGKYHAYLKYNRDTLRNHKFSIDGPAKLIEGQVLRGGEVVGAPGPTLVPQKNEVAEVIAATSKANSAGMELMQDAMKSSLELQRKAITEGLASPTGNAMADKVMDLLLKQLSHPQAPPQMDPLVQKLLDAAITSFTRKETPRPEPEQRENPLGQLTLVKDLFGAESLGDLIDMVRGNKGSQESPWYAGPLMKLVENIPQMIAYMSQMQQDAFQRSLIAHEVAQRGGRSVLPLPAVTTPGAIPGAAAAPVPESPIAIEQAMQPIVALILSAYDRGFDGWEAGTAIDLHFPEIVKQLRPVLADPNILPQFIAGVPELADRSRDPEWPEFQALFLEYMNAQEEPAAPPADARTTETAAVAAVGEVIPTVQAPTPIPAGSGPVAVPSTPMPAPVQSAPPPAQKVEPRKTAVRSSSPRKTTNAQPA
jgi:hypothetical protein